METREMAILLPSIRQAAGPCVLSLSTTNFGALRFIALPAICVSIVSSRRSTKSTRSIR